MNSDLDSIIKASVVLVLNSVMEKERGIIPIPL
jgi:hypothetical protein